MTALPQQIGKYQIRASLGEGAMGVVYEGFDPDIERRVAIKILHPHLVTEKYGEEFLARFKREARSAARCTHPNIVTVLEYGQDADTPYIVMEFVEGVTLQQLIKRGRAISLKNTLAIISQLLKALHSAHQFQIVHRDIKSANIMILKDGSGVKLADFGIARLDDKAELTMTGAVVGTPKYMAPEQMFGLKIDTRADLFSVAMVFAELLALMPKSDSIVCSPLPKIESLPPNNRIDYSILYPDALIPVLKKGLAVEQDKRYQTAREFASDIKAALSVLRASGGTGASTGAVQASTQKLSEQQDELESMTNMLVGYVGPIARNIMHAQSSQVNTIEELASAVSREIPHASEREAFLREWHNSSSTRLGISGVSQVQEPAGHSSRNFDDDMLNRIEDEFSRYIGPLAGRLVQHYSSSTRNLEELVNRLADEIPDASGREAFRSNWL
jgi:serine/threonine-protein kinase